MVQEHASTASTCLAARCNLDAENRPPIHSLQMRSRCANLSVRCCCCCGLPSSLLLSLSLSASRPASGSPGQLKPGHRRASISKSLLYPTCAQQLHPTPHNKAKNSPPAACCNPRGATTKSKQTTMLYGAPDAMVYECALHAYCKWAAYQSMR